MLALGAACTDDSEETSTPAPSSTVTSTATPTPTPIPTATIVATPQPTASPTPEPTATPIPTRLPDALAPGASALWAAGLSTPGVPWTSFRLTVGEPPEIYPWLIEMGSISVIRFQCRPTLAETTIMLGNCSGASFAASFSATIDLDTTEMTASYREPYGSGSRLTEATLTPVHERNEPPSDSTALVWRHHAPSSGSYTDIWVQDGIVFAPHFGGAVELLDASTGDLLGQFNAGSTVLDVKARDGVLYAATTSLGLLTYDVSDPTAPRALGSYAVWSELPTEAFYNVHNIFLGPDGDTIYAINDSHPRTDLRLIDVSDPAHPRESGRFVVERARSTLEGAHDVNVIEYRGRLIAFLDTLASGLYILDVTDPADIRIESRTAWQGTFSHSGWPYQLPDGRLIYFHGDEGHNQLLTIFDVTSLIPKRLAEFQTRPGTSPHNIEVIGTTAYVAYYIDGLRVLDLSDPATPREVAHYDTVSAENERDILQGAWGIHVVDGIAYVSDRETGIYALKVVGP